jgi:hypothetical protein
MTTESPELEKQNSKFGYTAPESVYKKHDPKPFKESRPWTFTCERTKKKRTARPRLPRPSSESIATTCTRADYKFCKRIY